MTAPSRSRLNSSEHHESAVETGARSASAPERCEIVWHSSARFARREATRASRLSGAEAMQPPARAPMAPPAAPPQQLQPPAQAPQAAPTQQPVTPPSGHGLQPIFPGIQLTYDQMCELHAIMFVLERSPVKPMSATSIKNMEQRHAEAKKTANAIVAAWRKTAEGRDLVIGKGINARLKPELWPPHVPQPASYYATEAQAAASPAPAAPQTVAVQPQAPARPAQKIDSNEAAPVVPSPNGGPVDIRTVTLDPESKEALKAHTEAMNNLAAALRGATFQGARQDGGNSGGAHQPVQPAAQVHQPAPAGPPQFQAPAGAPAAPPAPSYPQHGAPAAPPPPPGFSPAGGFQPPPAPAAPPVG